MNVRVRVGRVSRTLASAAAAALLLGAAASASAGTLDQQQTTSAPHAQALITSKSGAQTFTAGITGKLDQADLKLHKQGTPPPVVNVEIRSTSVGKPTATVLASSTIPASAVTTDAAGAFASATFATPASVTAGTQYALVAWSTGAGADDYAWTDQTAGNPYAGGAEFISSDPVPPGSGWTEFVGVDFAFKTYVVPTNAFSLGKVKKRKLILTVPGPGSITVANAGGGGSSALASAKKLLKRSQATATAAGQIKVPLRLTKAAKTRLSARGKLKARAAVTFTPTGGDPNTQQAKLKIKP